MEVNALGNITNEEERFDKVNAELKNNQLFTGRVMGLFTPIVMFTMNGVSIAVIWIAAYTMTHTATEIPVLLAIAFIMPPIARMGAYMTIRMKIIVKSCNCVTSFVERVMSDETRIYGRSFGKSGARSGHA